MNSFAVRRPDGVVHKVFSVEDLFRMAEVGLIQPDERLELIDGEIFELPPRGTRHDWLKTQLNVYFGRNCPENLIFVPSTGWKVDAITYLEPDFLFFRKGLRIDAVTAEDALLVIEVADSSLNFDMRTKAALYARKGVREYWVIDAAARETHVHLKPKHDGYAVVRTYAEGIRLEPSFLSGLKVTLSDMPA